MGYTVYYKNINSFFWKKLKRVKGDGFIENGFVAGADGRAIGTTKDIRWFILEDETRIEIPVKGIIFKFSLQRFMSIKQQTEKEIGQRI
jgi:hypothetical protein